MCGSQGGPCDPFTKMMLEELQRRNYAQNTVRTYIKIVESSHDTSAVHPIGWGPIRSANTRFTCFAIATFRPAPSNSTLPPFGFSM